MLHEMLQCINSHFLGQLVTDYDDNHWKIVLRRGTHSEESADIRHQDDFSLTEPARMLLLVWCFLKARVIWFVHPGTTVFSLVEKEKECLWSLSQYVYRKCYFSQRLFLNLCRSLWWLSESHGVFPCPQNSWQCKGIRRWSFFFKHTEMKFWKCVTCL